MNNWISSAVKHPGAFTAKAKKAGVSVRHYAQMKKDSNNKTLNKQANLALTLEKLRGKS